MYHIRFEHNVSLRRITMKTFVVMLGILAFAGLVLAEDMVISIHAVSADGIGKEIGKVTASDTKWGLLLKPDLSELPPGVHGFHLHEHASCEPGQKDGKMAAAHTAGAHLDPDKAGKHEGPYAMGHLGDLPPLYADSNGKSTVAVLAPRLKTTDLNGRALMIHAGADNFSDQPDPLGGGGARIACGSAK